MSIDPSLPPEPLQLTEASCQEIQLELIRRRRFNLFEGAKVVASLRKHRKLWRAVLMDRPGLPSADDTLDSLSLIKLRDLPGNHWNVDSLFILTEDLESARRLVEIATEDEWNVDVGRVHENEEERGRALGTSQPGYVVYFWWD